MKVVLRSRKSKVKPLMNEVFMLVGKVVLFTGAFFAFFYLIGLLYTLMSPVIDKLFDFTMENMVFTCIVLFVVMLVSGIFSVRYESLAVRHDRIVEERDRKQMAKRKLAIYNLKDNTERVV